MATIGKDGKDDAARVASLGASALKPAMAALGGAGTTRYYRANYTIDTIPALDVVASHLEFSEKMTLIGFVDAYGGTSSDSFFVVFNASSANEAQALANVSPLVITSGAKVSIQTLDTGISIWK